MDLTQRLSKKYGGLLAEITGNLKKVISIGNRDKEKVYVNFIYKDPMTGEEFHSVKMLKLLEHFWQ